MVEIIAGIHDHAQLLRLQYAIEPQRELGAADAAAKRNHVTGLDLGFHRKRSISLGRSSAAAETAGASQARPRTCTAGSPSAASPISSDAAEAISSAMATSVTRILRPNRSGSPMMLRNEGTPAAPRATPTTPLRQARPKLSLMTTPKLTPN